MLMPFRATNGRRIAIVLLSTVLLMAAALPSPASAQIPLGAGQVFGIRNAEPQGYSGVSAYMNFTPGPLAGSGTYGPVAVGTLFNTDTHIESGPSKACGTPGDDCTLHPYMSWNDGQNDGLVQVDSSLVLQEGGWYRYASYFIGNNNWIAYLIAGDGWHQLYQPVNLRTSSTLPYVGSGGEASCINNCSIGTAYTSDAQFEIGNTNWFNWCYTAVINNTNGQITACGSNFDWSASKYTG